MGKKNNMCLKCGETFKDHHQMNQHTTKQCQSLNLTKKIQKTQIFICAHCKTQPKVYSTKKQLSRHIRLVHEVKSVKDKHGPQQCPVCGQEGFFLSNLKIHLKSHQKEISLDLKSDLRLIKNALKLQQCVFCEKKFWKCNLDQHHKEVHNVNGKWEQINKQFEEFKRRQSYNDEMIYDLRKQFTLWKTEKKFQRFPKQLSTKIQLEGVNWIQTKKSCQLQLRQKHGVLALKNVFQIHDSLPKKQLKRWIVAMLRQAPQFGDKFILKDGAELFMKDMEENGFLIGKMTVSQRRSYRDIGGRLRYIVKKQLYYYPTKSLYQVYENLMCIEAFSRYESLYAGIKNKIIFSLQQSVRQKLSKYKSPEIFKIPLRKRWDPLRKKLVYTLPTKQVLNAHREYHLYKQKQKRQILTEGLFIQSDPWLKTPRQKKCFNQHLAELRFSDKQKQIDEADMKAKQIEDQYVEQILKHKIIQINQTNKITKQQVQRRQKQFWMNVDALLKKRQPKKVKKIRKRKWKLCVSQQMISRILKQKKWIKIGKWKWQQRDYGLRVTRPLTIRQKLRIETMETAKARLILSVVSQPNKIIQHHPLLTQFTNPAKMKTVFRSIQRHQEKKKKKFNQCLKQVKFEEIKLKTKMKTEQKSQPISRQHQIQLQKDIQSTPERVEPELIVAKQVVDLEPEPLVDAEPIILEKPSFHAYVGFRGQKVRFYTKKMIINLKKLRFNSLKQKDATYIKKNGITWEKIRGWQPLPLLPYVVIEEKEKLNIQSMPNKKWADVVVEVGKWYRSEEAKQLYDCLKMKL